MSGHAARRLLASCALLLVLLAAERARARELDFAWDAPDGCPDERAGRRLLGGYLDPLRAVPAAEQASIEVHIRRLPEGRFAAAVTVENGDTEGERELMGTDCADVAEAAALVAAMLLDPASVAENVAAAGAGEPERTADSDEARIRLALFAHLLGDAGSVPQSTLGGGLGASLVLGRLQLSLRATALWPQPSERGPTPTSGGEIGLFVAGVRGSYAVLQAAGGGFGSGPSAGLEAGVALGRGRGLDQSRTQGQLWLAPAVGWHLHVNSGNFSAALLLEALVPLHRPSWALDDYAELFRAPWLAPRLSLELGWLLPWP